MTAHHLFVVPHTHWDREWHQSFEGFRQRLVPVLDRVLELLEGDPAFRHFTLDGQTIVVGDYLEVRPEARERLAELVRDGRLVVGPWTVLPDEWLVSGEALIRNLRLGLQRARELGGAMQVGYVPDQFGHVGQLPQLFAGFAFEGAVVWRGVGADVDRTCFWWEAPDGTRIFSTYLVNGYGNAGLLPLEPDSLADRLRLVAAGLQAFRPSRTLLLMNGGDHQAPQPALPAALEAALQRLPGWSFEIGTLPGYLERARLEAGDSLPVHRGELRSGLRAPLLPGCASSRMAQKRRDFLLDSLLTRHVEPLAAALQALGGHPDTGGILHAWRRVLENHPHDSICGCSADEVHAEIETRLAGAESAVRAQLERVASAVAAQVAVPRDGFGAHCGESFVVWNPNAPGQTLVECALEADLALRGGRVAPFHVRDAQGRRLAARAELLEAGHELLRWTLPPAVLLTLLPGLSAEIGGARVCGAALRLRGRRLELELRLSEAPSGFDAEPFRRRLRTLCSSGDVDTVTVRARRLPRLLLRFVDTLPGWGWRVYRFARGPAGVDRAALASARLPDGGAALENRHWRVQVDAAGRVRIEHRASGAVVEDALRVVSEGDRGDEYDFDPVPGDVPVERPRELRIRVHEDSEAEVGLTLAARYRVPRGLAPGRRARSRATVTLPVTLRLRLARDLDRLEIGVELNNRARDHRLRLHVSAPFDARRFRVESAFEVVERPVAPEAPADASARPGEPAAGAVPQRSFASLDDGRLALSVANRGGGEVEAVRERDGRSSLALTLLRSVGWLSRDDLVCRPGHAGPALATPGAQVPGSHRLEFSLRLHSADDPSQSVEAHRFAHPPLARCGGGSEDAPLADGARLLALDDPALVVSACEPRAMGGPVARLYNASGVAREARLGSDLPGLRGGRAVDLAERVGGEGILRVEAGGLRLGLRPWQILTLRLGSAA